MDAPFVVIPNLKSKEGTKERFEMEMGKLTVKSSMQKRDYQPQMIPQKLLLTIYKVKIDDIKYDFVIYKDTAETQIDKLEISID